MIAKWASYYLQVQFPPSKTVFDIYLLQYQLMAKLGKRVLKKRVERAAAC